MKTRTIYGQNKMALIVSACKSLIFWLRGVDLNHRPLGYECNSSPQARRNKHTAYKRINAFRGPESARLGSFRTPSTDKKRTICLALLVLAVAPAFGQTVSLPFKTVRSVMLVEVTVDNQPKTLVFDTGAERTMIQSPRNIQQLVTITFQNRLAGYFPVVLTDFGRKNEMATLHADGILGNDVLSTYERIVIDYKTHTIELLR